MIYDIAVIGGGPAGLSAVVTGRIRNKSVLLFDHMGMSQKLRRAHKIENYLGLSGMDGDALMETFQKHALSYDPQWIKEKVTSIFPGEEAFTLLTGDKTFEAKTIILTIGVSTSATLPGEKELLGRGVSYCATCDGQFYRGRTVAVVATTAEAADEADYLAELCKEVVYFPRYKEKTLPKHANIRVETAIPKAIIGENTVTALRTDAGEIAVDGVFLLRESDPVDSILAELHTENGAISVNASMATNIPGVFAAGDCAGQPWQISKATGQGLTAVLSAIAWLAKKG